MSTARIKEAYKAELAKITTQMASMDPKTDAYGNLLGKAKSLEALILTIDKNELDEELRLQEFQLKKERENLERKLRTEQNERDRKQAEDRTRLDEERIKNDLRKEQINAAKDVSTTFVRGGLALAGTLIGAKVTIAVASGMLSDEESGKLILSSVKNVLPRPSLNILRF